MKLYQDKRITVAGLGVHGGAAGNVRWLADQGAIITVTDLRSAEELAPSLAKLENLSNIRYVLGEHRESDFTNTDLVLQNPAVRRDSPYLQAARRAGVPTTMDSSLFFKHSPTRTIIGVTGSKGKSTTVHMIAKLLRLKYANVITIGNEGTSPLAALPLLDAHSIVVFELSSWRLESLGEHHLSPQTAVVTSLYPDHLNTYDSFDHYLDAKQNIVRYQHIDDRALLNYDDELVRSWQPHVRARGAWFSLQNSIPDRGICVDRGMLTLVTARGTIPLFSINDVNVKSEHEQRNILPAVYLAFMSGVRTESMRLCLTKSGGLSHRLETIRSLHGITFINDSAATIPEATTAALHALKDRHIVLICGGSDKKLNFEIFGRAVANAHIRSFIFLPGDATEHMQHAIRAAYRQPPSMIQAVDMPDAVARACEVAQENDVVLLSPGATSFGLFQHEFDRGNQFRAAVGQLA